MSLVDKGDLSKAAVQDSEANWPGTTELDVKLLQLDRSVGVYNPDLTEITDSSDFLLQPLIRSNPLQTLRRKVSRLRVYKQNHILGA
jgi:hypothetical protein